MIIGVSLFMFERNFFQSMPKRITFEGGYYVEISKCLSFLSIPLPSYSYEFNLPGYYSKGYLINEDSIISRLGPNNSRFKLLNFKRDQKKIKNVGISIPSFEFYKKDENENFYFKFIPATFSLLPNVDFILYKLSFKEGFKGFLIKYDNNEVKIYGKY